MTIEEKAEDFYFKKYNQTLNIGEEERQKAITEAYIAGAKENGIQWHNVKKNPNDLPTKEQLGKTFVVAFGYNEKTQKYYSFDCAEYIDKGKFITHTVNADNENNGYKVIAWKEIVLPELKESE